jgi:hypothetical protein
MTTTPAMLVLPLGLVILMAPAAASARPGQAPEPRRDATAASDASAGGRRVIVTAPSAPARSCAAATCEVVTELEKGAVVSVLKTDGDWHQVLVRVGGTAMTTGWVRAGQVAATTAGVARTGSGTAAAALRADGSAPAPAGDADPRGCLTCLATREPTREEWSAALADAATRKVRPEDRPVEAGLADGRTSDERMRDAFEARYGDELTRLGAVAADVDRELQAYLAACVERFASIPVEGAAPRTNAVDEILRAARSSPGAARFQLWAGTAAFAWQDSWEPQAEQTSALPSCGRLWEDARAHADRLKVDLELLERDAGVYNIYPGVVREALEARALAEPMQPPPTAPVTTVK